MSGRQPDPPNTDPETDNGNGDSGDQQSPPPPDTTGKKDWH